MTFIIKSQSDFITCTEYHCQAMVRYVLSERKVFIIEHRAKTSENRTVDKLYFLQSVVYTMDTGPRGLSAYTEKCCLKGRSFLQLLDSPIMSSSAFKKSYGLRSLISTLTINQVNMNKGTWCDGIY